jgi:hypothetical protein
MYNDSSVQIAVSEANRDLQSEILELAEVELACIGGGIGNTIL